MRRGASLIMMKDGWQQHSSLILFILIFGEMEIESEDNDCKRGDHYLRKCQLKKRDCFRKA